MTTVTRPTPTPHGKAQANAYAALLAGYVTGQIAEGTFDTFCDAMDSAPATADERLAFARFYLDAVATGETEHALPRPEELADVLLIARA